MPCAALAWLLHQQVGVCQKTLRWAPVVACGHQERLVFTSREPAWPSVSQGEPGPLGCPAALFCSVHIHLSKWLKFRFGLFTTGIGQNFCGRGSRNSCHWCLIQLLSPLPCTQTASLFCLGLSAAGFLLDLAYCKCSLGVLAAGQWWEGGRWQKMTHMSSDLVWSYCLSPVLSAFH